MARDATLIQAATTGEAFS